MALNVDEGVEAVVLAPPNWSLIWTGFFFFDGDELLELKSGKYTDYLNRSLLDNSTECMDIHFQVCVMCNAGLQVGRTQMASQE